MIKFPVKKQAKIVMNKPVFLTKKLNEKTVPT
jgi:hypothetical protein